MKSWKRKSSKKETNNILTLQDEIDGTALYHVTIDKGQKLLQLPNPATRKLAVTVIVQDIGDEPNWQLKGDTTNYSTSVGTPAEWTPIQ